VNGTLQISKLKYTKYAIIKSFELARLLNIMVVEICIYLTEKRWLDE
jgi:hypothetical protein